MTTTAEKIAVMQAFEDGKEIEHSANGVFWGQSQTPTWNWEALHYRIKPEPLAAWANLYPSGRMYTYSTKEGAERGALPSRSALVYFTEAERFEVKQ